MSESILTLDTSTERCDIGIFHRGEWFNEVILGVQSHAKESLLVLDALMKASQLNGKDLSAIVVGQGPGSFTGLRVALSIAKGLSVGFNVPIFGVKTHDAIFETWSSDCPQNLDVMVMVDARMQQWYWAYYVRNRMSHNIQLTSLCDIAIPSAPFHLIGVGIEAHVDMLGYFEKTALSMTTVYPNAKGLYLAHLKGLSTHLGDDDGPYYIRDALYTQDP
jgi:tRNA threonylcarbamoyladenosine biosynthesis protein TsaB